MLLLVIVLIFKILNLDRYIENINYLIVKNCPNLQKIYYIKDEPEWSNIKIGSKDEYRSGNIQLTPFGSFAQPFSYN